MVPAGHERVLATVCARFAGSRFAWAVSGSVALALHGLEVECGDLDLLTTATAAPRVAALLGGETLEPLRFRERGALRGQIGRVRLESVEIEILGDVQNRLPGGAWTAPPPLDVELVVTEHSGRRCPVVSLPALRVAYAAMDRPDKVALIDAAG